MRQEKTRAEKKEEKKAIKRERAHRRLTEQLLKCRMA